MKKAIFAFVLGAAAGSAATWCFVKKKYEQIAQEEIESVKQRFTYEKLGEALSKGFKDGLKNCSDPDVSEEAKKLAEQDAETIKDEPPLTVAEYARMLAKEGYTNYSNAEDIPEEQSPLEELRDVNPDPQDKPYVIPPESFGEFDDYGNISLTYYADEVLCDENDEPLEDIEGAVGADFFDHFGEYEDDSVFVRNDRLKCDYEILKSLRTYTEVLKEKPYLRGEH